MEGNITQRTRDVAENCEKNVDEQVGPTSCLEENAKRRQDDCEDELEDVCDGEHDDVLLSGREFVSGTESEWKSQGERSAFYTFAFRTIMSCLFIRRTIMS